ncbi:hypothetical protein IFT75_02060 [Pseudomonas sp. CFBP 8758]|uniref:hypothetical protein n=1 Tax=Pseudomonas sp. CFBP 8758 TaxID=2775286 RepID=UPI00177DAF2C|nr:hypothetical protein [Pseudomonas sp. CFBP 8758]MBD8592186.1 hypothetical protein [Pseudomonas sp. CFBP 8758]
MVKPTPDSPVVDLPSDHPLFHFATDFSETDGRVLAERFQRQRALMEQARRNAQRESQPPRRFWQFWRT